MGCVPRCGGFEGAGLGAGILVEYGGYGGCLGVGLSAWVMGVGFFMGVCVGCVSVGLRLGDECEGFGVRCFR